MEMPASEGQLRVVLDTDTYNEVDDQFAVVHALLSPERIKLEALYAAPFHNSRSEGPADGMEKSYDEIIRLLERLGVSESDRVFKGSDRYLPSRTEPVRSAAAEHLVDLANSGEGPLYVAAIGAITNVASAILLDPGITERIVVVWLGGQPTHWPTAREFNLRQDVVAAQVVFDSGASFVHIPCATVASHLLTTIAELAEYVQPQGDIGRYLFDICESYRQDQYAWSKEIWDIAATGWLIDESWVPSTAVPSPILTDQVTWSVDASRHSIRIAHGVRRNAIFGDLFRKMERFARGELAPSWS
ncbi:MAG: nucleoside hydrolase [Candidatus Latescibacteria bacterium]|jgi:inosine-uridine nucleoside N-ribohydrolase|nr:nucleoside hydrolase [Gemmatimonadaceae bacterium]MDP6015141.1 nucleoside hydrolase [Candidatus Latescibacterota bacterium]MDP7450222.1 nucleoside hydrolase [Candidatus Latescibacterota bacterium]HJP33025.1 nucleoside hydrolase [Candidatus Latescibacterota bacterium]